MDHYLIRIELMGGLKFYIYSYVRERHLKDVPVKTYTPQLLPLDGKPSIPVETCRSRLFCVAHLIFFKKKNHSLLIGVDSNKLNNKVFRAKENREVAARRLIGSSDVTIKLVVARQPSRLLEIGARFAPPTHYRHRR